MPAVPAEEAIVVPSDLMCDGLIQGSLPASDRLSATLATNLGYPASRHSCG